MIVQIYNDNYGNDDLIGEGSYRLDRIYSIPNKT